MSERPYLLERDNVRRRTVRREVVHDEFQKRGQFIPPFLEIVSLFLHAIKDFDLCTLANRIIYVDDYLIQDLRK